jgi:hypothetical protein
MLGQPATPALGYEPGADPDSRRQIRLDGDLYTVSKLPDEVAFTLIPEMMKEMSMSYEALQAHFAHSLLHRKYSSDGVIVGTLTLLANSGWTHINEEVLEIFCAANNLDMGEAA